METYTLENLEHVRRATDEEGMKQASNSTSVSSTPFSLEPSLKNY